MPAFQKLLLHLPLFRNQLGLGPKATHKTKIEELRTDLGRQYHEYHQFINGDVTESKKNPCFDYILAQHNQLRLLGRLGDIKPAGLVHLSWLWGCEGHFSYDEPIQINTHFEVRNTVQQGQILSFVAHMMQSNYTAQHESEYLYRQKNPEAERLVLPFRNHTITDREATTSMVVSKQMGRQYANLAIDFNPIHMSSILAKMFGMPNACAHGMYVVSRMLSTQEPHHISALKAYFLRPVSYEKKYSIDSEIVADQKMFLLRDNQTGKNHIAVKVETTSSQ